MKLRFLGASRQVTGSRYLLEAGGLNLLFDTGRGSATRLMQLGVSLGTIEGVFVTHFHSDHLNGFSDVWMTGYLGPHGGLDRTGVLAASFVLA